MLSPLLRLLFPTGSYDREGLEKWIVTIDPTHAVHEDMSALRRRGVRYLDSVTAAATFRSTPRLRDAIWHMKYRRDRAVCRALATALLPHAFMGLRPDTVVCAVPLHPFRHLSRGFNQAHVLACEITRTLDIPMRRLLARRRYTGSQARRHRDQRLHAMTDAFTMVDDRPFSGHVILIDDVCTTGATLDECAQVLKNAAVKRVDAIVLAHDVLPLMCT